MSTNKYNLNACEQAERLYNYYQTEVVLPMTLDDKVVNSILKLYYEVLQELRDNGIGGVLINGVYRNLYE